MDFRICPYSILNLGLVLLWIANQGYSAEIFNVARASNGAQCTASSSGTIFGETYYCSYAIDVTVDARAWYNGGTNVSGSWLNITFNDTYVITSVSLTQPYESSSRIKVLQVRYLNQEPFELNIPAQRTYQYNILPEVLAFGVRLTIKEVYGRDDLTYGFSDVSVMGYKEPTFSTVDKVDSCLASSTARNNDQVFPCTRALDSIRGFGAWLAELGQAVNGWIEIKFKERLAIRGMMLVQPETDPKSRIKLLEIDDRAGRSVTVSLASDAVVTLQLTPEMNTDRMRLTIREVYNGENIHYGFQEITFYTKSGSEPLSTVSSSTTTAITTPSTTTTTSTTTTAPPPTTTSTTTTAPPTTTTSTTTTAPTTTTTTPTTTTSTTTSTTTTTQTTTTPTTTLTTKKKKVPTATLR